MNKKSQSLIISSLFLIIPSLAAATTTMSDVFCSIVTPVIGTIWTVGGTLVMLMFLYGGVKYVFSSDDAGGRKQGKTICIHALIGGVLLVLVSGFVTLLNLGASVCPQFAATGVPL